MGANHTRQAIDALSELIGRQRRLVPVCAIDNEAANRAYTALDKLDTVIGRELRILVIGQFASGKNTLFNALLGEELPLKELLMELHYGVERRAIIYPRKGFWRGGDRPFEIVPSREELERYCGWAQVDNGYPAEALFEKVEIFIPSPVLEQGITFIKVPATIFDATYHSDNLFHHYLHYADIVLYVVSATRVFSNYDRECLNLLRMLLAPGVPLLFAVTSFNVVPPEEKQEFVDYVRGIALQYTADLGSDAIHFVDSRDALEAQRTDDHVLLMRSGISQLRQYLTNDLCRKKNYEKIADIIRQMEQINVDLSAQIETQYDVDVPDYNRTSAAFDAFRERSEELLGAQLQIELIRQELNNLLSHCE